MKTTKSTGFEPVLPFLGKYLKTIPGGVFFPGKCGRMGRYLLENYKFIRKR
jgi:hypothetical protein